MGIFSNNWWTYYDTLNSDKRIVDWPFMSLQCMLFMTALYFLILYFGKTFMEKREAFKLKNVMVVYNFLLVLLSGYMGVQFTRYTYFRPGGWNMFCQTPDYSNTEINIKLLRIQYLYYVSKFLEYFDTFFFVLKKNFRQITFLHVFHHSSMASIWWFGARYSSGGDAFFPPMCNSYVHAVMYIYYGLSAAKVYPEKLNKYKILLTVLQMTQFAIVFVKATVMLVMDCGHNRFIVAMLLLYCVTMMTLFGNFCRKTYLKKIQ